MAAVVSAIAFARRAGALIDARASVSIETQRDATLLVTVEPVEHTPRGFELAGLALRTIREQFSLSAGVSPAIALERAMRIANATLVTENRPLAGCRWERRVAVGATAVVIHGGEAFIAQYPPTQLVVMQGTEVLSFPELASWRETWMPAADAPEPEAMGLVETARPVCMRTSVSVGDRLLLGSSGVGRAFSRGDEAELFAAMLGEAPDCDALTDLAVAAADACEVRDLTVLSVRVDAFARSTVHMPDRAWSERAGVAAPVWLRKLATRPAQLVARASTSVGEGTLPRVGGAAGSIALPLPGNPFEGLRFPTPPPRRRRRSVSSVPPLRAPGTRRMERHVATPGISTDVLAWLPRGIEQIISARALVLTLVLIAAVGVSVLGYGWTQQRERTGSVALAQADQAIALAMSNPVAAGPALADAEASLAAAEGSGIGEAETLARWQDVEAAREQAWGITRITDLTAVGTLPAAIRAAQPTLVAWGYHAYLIGDGVYQVADDGGALIEVLAPGAMVQGKAIGPIIAGGASDTGLVVTDGTWVLRWNGKGPWVRSPLLDPEDVTWNDVTVAAFNGTLYRLADGAITKLVAGPVGVINSAWVDASMAADLIDATDMQVGERVSVLLADGRILTFYTGALEQSEVVPVAPEISGETRFADAAGSPYLWIVEPSAMVGDTEGRLLRYQRGGIVEQFVLPSPRLHDGTPDEARYVFAHPDEVAVSDLAGKVFLLKDGVVWSGTLNVGSPT